MTSEPDKPKRRRRFRQFSLRTLLVVVTVLCVWLGWLVHRADDPRKAVQWVRRTGGFVYFDHGNVVPVNDPAPRSPKWLSDLIGPVVLYEVVCVDLSFTRPSDLTPLAGLEDLQALYLEGARVSDLTPLAGLKNLKVLNLEDTQVSEERVEKLRQALPNCFIWWSPPDPSP